MQMNFTVTYHDKDMTEAYRIFYKICYRWNNFQFSVLAIVFYSILFLVLSASDQHYGLRFAAFVGLSILAFFFYYHSCFRRWLRQNLQPAPGIPTDDILVEMNEDVLALSWDKNLVRLPWTGILKAHATLKYLFLFIEPDRAYILPAANFPSPEDYRRIIDFLQEQKIGFSSDRKAKDRS